MPKKTRKKDTFLGYVREDGQVGVRNHLLMLSGTLYANSLCERVSNAVIGALPIAHPLGRCQAHCDLALTRLTLAGHGANANAGAVIVVDHFKEEGCTADDIAHDICKRSKKRVEVINIRRDGGALNSTHKAMKLALDMIRDLSKMRREEVPVSKLIFGLNCGTSDTTSGISSNKALGVCSDKVIGLGGRSIQAEVTEMMGGEHVLTAKAKNKKVAQKILDMIDRKEKLLVAVGEDIRGSQPTGDNIAGGLSSIEEKSLGAIQKGGKALVEDVIGFADPCPKKSGLYLMDTPGHGGESITGIAAAGSQIMVFSTGGGHTINHPLMVTLRVTGHQESFDLMEPTMEINVSDIFEGTSIAAAGERIYDTLLDTASGTLTKCEILKENNAFAIHRIGPST